MRADLDHISENNCLVNSTDIVPLKYDKKYMFRLYVNHTSIIDNTTYYSIYKNKKSNDYDNLKLYGELKYPPYTQSSHCYFNNEKNKVKYDDQYNQKQDKYFIVLMFGCFIAGCIGFHFIYEFLLVSTMYCSIN